MKEFVSAIIVSAGNSTRMGANKQFIDICGKPAIAHTLIAFELSDVINEIIVVCKKEHVNKMMDIIKENGIKKVSAITFGGINRQESVELGIKSVNKASTYFCVHDGARILITPETIYAVVNKAFEHKCAALGVMVKDTMKVVDSDSFIEFTPDRSKLWAVQTPQVFEKKVYLKALENAKKSNKDYTDDCQLLENDRSKVFMLKGDYSNIKLTTIEDIELAKTIINGRED